MQINRAIEFLPYFWLGIVYCLFSNSVDRFLIRYKYPILVVSGVISLLMLFGGTIDRLCGILFMLTIGLMVAEKMSDRFLKLSLYTYAVFLLSYFPQMLMLGPVARMLPNVNEYVLSAVSFLLGLSIPVLIAWLYLRYSKKYSILKKGRILIGL